MQRNSRLHLSSFAGAVLGLALCGTPGLLAADAATAASRAVTIEAIKYDPPEITVRAGQPVVFKNLDLVPHTVTADTPGKFDSNLISGNAEWTLTIDERGSFPYHCKLHPEMHGVIIVQ